MKPRKKPITTGGAGYIPAGYGEQISKLGKINLPHSLEDARLRLYRQVDPRWGYTDDTFKATTQSLLYGNNKFNREIRHQIDPWGETVWAEYLKIPHKYRFNTPIKLEESKYKPTVGKDLDKKYYKIWGVDPNADTQFFTPQLIKEGSTLQFGKNKNTTLFSPANMGESTIGRGVDDRGDYISYYDEWDLNPLSGRYSNVSWNNNKLVNKLGLNKSTAGDMSFGLGTPLYFYDRVHLDDYYGVDSSARPGTYYGGYLPEIFVESFGSGHTTNSMGDHTEFGVPLKPRRK